MRTSFGRVGNLTVVILLVAACGSQEPSSQKTDDINIGYVDGNSSEVTSAEHSETSNLAEPFPSDVSVNLADFSSEGDQLESESSQAKIWVGMSGVPQGCTLTNYHNLRDVQAVMQNDDAVVVEKTPSLIILRKSAPKGQYKVIYSTDEALCEVVVSGSGFTEDGRPDSVLDENGNGN